MAPGEGRWAAMAVAVAVRMEAESMAAVAMAAVAMALVVEKAVLAVAVARAAGAARAAGKAGQETGAERAAREAVILGTSSRRRHCTCLVAAGTAQNGRCVCGGTSRVLPPDGSRRRRCRLTACSSREACRRRASTSRSC